MASDEAYLQTYLLSPTNPMNPYSLVIRRDAIYNSISGAEKRKIGRSRVLNVLDVLWYVLYAEYRNIGEIQSVTRLIPSSLIHRHTFAQPLSLILNP